MTSIESHACTKLTGPLVQYWHSEKVPADIIELTNTFREMNPTFNHLIFNERWAREFIGEHFSIREVEAFRACAVPAMQADYFRYCAIFALGGIYVDVDFRCVRPLDHLLRDNHGAVFFRTPGGSIGNGFFLTTTPRHPLLRLILELVTINIERRAAERIWRVTGPWILNVLVKIQGLGSLAAAREVAAESGVGQSAKPLLDAIGEYSRVVDALSDVRILTLDPKTRCVEEAKISPAYKRSTMHWVNWQEEGRSIFR